MATVFVAKDGERIAGYYALATGGVEAAHAPDRVTKGVPSHPIPVVILTRLAVTDADKGRGLGKALLGDALRRIDGAAEEIGVRAMLVHAKDRSAADFYMKHAEFEPSPSDDLHLFLLMKDLRKALEA